MKKTILSLALLLAVGGTAPICAQRHRHTPRPTTTAAAPQPSATTPSPTAAAQTDDEFVAYSDTAENADTADVAQYGSYDGDEGMTPDKFKDPFSWMAYMGTGSVMMGLIAFAVVLLFFLLLLSPFAILYLLIRYLLKRHNDRVRMAEKAMETGRQLDEELMPLSRKSPEYVWRRGVRNVSIGAGLMLFFYFLGATSLVGIGGLVVCLGLGQMFMARYNFDSKFKFGRKHKTDGFDDMIDVNDIKYDATEKDSTDTSR